MQLKIQNQSMTILTMQTKNSKNEPERRVRRTEVYTCSKSLTNPRPCWRCWPKMKNRTRKAGGPVRSARGGPHVTRAAEGKFEQNSKPIEFTTTDWTNYEKTQRTKDDRRFPINPSSQKSLNNLPGIGNTRKMAISRFLVPIFKISSIAAWQISVTNGSYPPLLVQCDKNPEMSQSSQVWHCDIWKCHKMSQNFTLFSNLQYKATYTFYVWIGLGTALISRYKYWK